MVGSRASLVRHGLAVTLPLSLVVAAGNLATLTDHGRYARIRDLRVLRLLRRIADLAGWNFLASAPRWVHAELDLGHGSAWIPLAAAAAVAGIALLLPIVALAAALPPRFRRPAAVVAPLTGLTLPIATGGLSPLVMFALVVLLGTLSFAVVSRMNAGDLGALLRHSAAAALAILACAILASPFVIHKPPEVRPAAAAGAPNVILISIDSLRADHLHAYGYDRDTSPNLDRLAAEGTRFETVMSPTSWTLPSHMTLMTSLPPEKHGVTTQRMRLPGNLDTLPARLQRAGYDTAGIVSATYLDGLFGFSRGFDEYDDYSLLHAAGERSRREITSPQLAQRAIDWLERRAQARPGRPFFLFLHMFDVHYDYNPPAPFDHMFDPTYRGPVDGDVGTFRSPRAPRDLQHLVALYDGEIAFVDAHIGEILTALHELGLENNTIVAVTADHGEEFFDHGAQGHNRTLYDEVLHIPLIIRYPGRVPAGRAIAGQVRLMDVGPTLLDLAGVRVHAPAKPSQATSLASLLRGDSATVPLLPAFGDLRGNVASIRLGGVKLIRDLHTHREELYDLVADPHELHNLYRAHAPQFDKMRVCLSHWRSGATATGEQIELGDEERSTLQSLGYLH